MSKWELFETYLHSTAGMEFNSITVAQDLGVSGDEASDLIQAYLAAQRRPNSETGFVLSRRGRANGAVWHIGVRSDDVRSMTYQLLDDMDTRLTRGWGPDLQRASALNPRTGQLVENLHHIVVGNFGLLVAQIP
jgi:hypothetical protein